MILNEEKTYTIKEAAAELGLKPLTLPQYLERGRLRGKKELVDGKSRWLIPQSSIDYYRANFLGKRNKRQQVTMESLAQTENAPTTCVNDIEPQLKRLTEIVDRLEQIENLRLKYVVKEISTERPYGITRRLEQYMRAIGLLFLVLFLPTLAIAQTHTFTLTWTDSATNEEGTRFERCQGAGCTNFLEVFSLIGANIIEAKDTIPNTGLGGLVYRYRIRYFNAQGVSPYSNIADGTTPLIPQPPNAAPSNLQISALSADAIQLSWIDNATNETAQRINWESWQPPRHGAIMVAANTTGLVIEGLKKNTPYCAEVVALAGEIESAPSNETCTRTLKW